MKRSTRAGVTLAALLSAGVLAPAAAGAATVAVIPAVSVPTIDCSGDQIDGATQIQRFVPKATVQIRLWKQSGSWAVVDSKTLKMLKNQSTLSYSFTLASHGDAYKVEATPVGGTNKFSATISDDNCAPPADVPEAAIMAFIPTSLIGTAAVVGFRRRRMGRV